MCLLIFLLNFKFMLTFTVFLIDLGQMQHTCHNEGSFSSTLGKAKSYFRTFAYCSWESYCFLNYVPAHTNDGT